MRISTAQIYAAGVSTMGRQQRDLVTLQQQLSTGSRVLVPSDDPVAAARALETTQSINRLTLEGKNQGTATDALKYLDSQLGAVSDILNYVRERTVSAGNGSFPEESKRYLATDIRQQFDALLSLANSRDAVGEYVFSGYKGETQPFTGNLTDVRYQGDEGQRSLQVSNTRLMPTSVSGSELFMKIASPNGAFSTQSSSDSAIVSAGTVTGPAAYTGGQFGIRFTSATAYEVFDLAADPGMSGTPLATGAYTSGQQIGLPDPGDPATQQISVAVSGSPVAGDVFSTTPGASSDMFSTLQSLVVGLESVTDKEGYNQMVADTLNRLDEALENVNRLRAQVGSRQLEVESLQTVGEDLNLQYADRMERLVGVNYVSAISDFQLQNYYLEAARTTFAKVSGMSLFNFLS
ncbi:MAG: flagellar hook-associated protein FlgL [Candidatus Dactylopiibacterium sp.]|nr:flagellar hook-associated protein FlgL [Candidatus Dactylopiibacterium sp.]